MISKKTPQWSRQAFILAIALLAAPGGALGQGAPHKSGAQVPRFVSLKSDEVNIRRGPGYDHAITWVFHRAGLPVEILAEFEVWRQVRDSEGATGWVLSTLLSGRRTALVAPGRKNTAPTPLYDASEATASIRANLESGVLLNVKSCNGRWCNVMVNNTSGWIDQNTLWGVYPNEVIQ